MINTKNIAFLRGNRANAHRLIMVLSLTKILLHMIDPGIGPISFWLQTAIWLVFLAYTTVYTTIAYRSPFWKVHRAEWVVILFGNPWVYLVLAGGTPPDNSVKAFLHGIMLCQLISLTAHFWIVIRAFRAQWGKHPIFASLLCLVSVTFLVATLLRYYEPTTFSNWGITLWFCLETLSTVGYGDVVPRSDSGRVLSAILIIFGTGVHAVMTALVGQRLLDLAVWVNPVFRKRSEQTNARAKSAGDEESRSELQSQYEALQNQLDQIRKLLEEKGS